MDDVVKVKFKDGKAYTGTFNLKEVELPPNLFALLKSKGEGEIMYVSKHNITPVKKEKNEDNQ